MWLIKLPEPALFSDAIARITGARAGLSFVRSRQSFATIPAMESIEQGNKAEAEVDAVRAWRLDCWGLASEQFEELVNR